MTTCKQSLISIISKLVHENWSKIVDGYEYLHANPELSLNEYNTAKYIKQFLSHLPHVKVTDCFAPGVIATIEGQDKGRAIALRCDMDALPVNEMTTLTYRSRYNNVMHACGHDAHMAIMLGVATVLNELKDLLPYTVRLIFQPCEEKEPGGAKMMIEAGCLQNPPVERCYGLHVDPNLNIGKILTMAGPFYARCDSFDILIRGRSKHIARPEGAINPVPVMTKILDYIEKLKKEEDVVIGIGYLQGGVARNIIPALIKIEGTLRTYDDEQRLRIIEKLDYYIKYLGGEENCLIELVQLGGYPYLNNDPQVFKETIATMEEIIGKGNVVTSGNPLLISEDFAYYAEQVPSCFYNLGIGKIDGNDENYDLHSAKMVVPVSALFYGILIQATLTLIPFGKDAHKVIHQLGYY